jgi:hypothetical protein
MLAMDYNETKFSNHLLMRATARGRELAWSLPDIPKVIEAAEAANLISIGGQLQFRFPNGGTCECNWVEVDTFKTVSPDLPWHERVSKTSTAALSQFLTLQARYDFIAEGRRAFRRTFDEFETGGGDPKDAMCFVWYVDAE